MVATQASSEANGSTDGRVLWLVATLLFISVASYVAFTQVERGVDVDQGGWQLEFDFLPTWLPVGFRGELAKLEDLPRTITLRDAQWRDHLSLALEANPWIDSVERLEKRGSRVSFQAIFRRPVVALVRRGGFLLIDSQGRILDRQPGSELQPSWGLPYCRLSEELQEGETPGSFARSKEAAQLISLVEALWKARIFERWAGKIPEIGARVRPDGSSRWSLFLANGTELVWGRAPRGARVDALPVHEKLENLQDCLVGYDELQGVPRVTLYSGTEPVVEF